MEHQNRWRQLVGRMFPFIGWFKGYQASYLQGDLIAGLTVAVVLIPQSMAYAMLAGLPPVYGLYAGVTAPLVGALWGSLRQLATGPIAIMSLLVLTTLTPMAEPGSLPYIELAFLLAFMVGVLYLLIGLFRLGVMMYFISHSAIKGFTAAASLIIISTQLPHFLGIELSRRHEYIFHMLVDLAGSLTEIHLATFLIGLLAAAIIFSLKKINRNLPAGLIGLIITTILVFGFDMHESGVAVVGKSPQGLPRFQMPIWDLDIMSDLLGPAVVIALVSFAETYSVGKAVSTETKQKLNVDQELIGQGMANLVGSFFQGYPVSGSFSRTAINYDTGAKSGISSVASSLIVMLALLFLTPLFTYIPKAALAALVINAVLLLFHPKEVFVLWKMNRHDGIVALTVFVLALLAKPDYALLIGVMISLMFLLWKTMHPRIVRITKDPELNMFINADMHQKASCPQILQLRCDNFIYFANAEYTVDHILERLDEYTTPIKFLLLDFQAVSFIDLTGVDELRILLEEAKARGVELAFISVHLPVKQVFESSGFNKEIRLEHLLDKRVESISHIFEHIDHVYCKEKCPYTLYTECSTVK